MKPNKVIEPLDYVGHGTRKIEKGMQKIVHDAIDTFLKNLLTKGIK